MLVLDWLRRWRKPADFPSPATHPALDGAYLRLDGPATPATHLTDVVRFSLDCPGCGEPFDEVRTGLSFACPGCGRVWRVWLEAWLVGPLDTLPQATIERGSMVLPPKD